MGKKMDKATIIYGANKSVPLANFNGYAEVTETVQKYIGPNEQVNLTEARRAVQEANADKKMKTAYIKVGEVGSDLVLRAKQDKWNGDIEYDGVLVKGYKAKVTAFDKAKADATAAFIAQYVNNVELGIQNIDENAERFRNFIQAKNQIGAMTAWKAVQKKIDLLKKACTAREVKHQAEVAGQQYGVPAKLLPPLAKLNQYKTQTRERETLLPAMETQIDELNEEILSQTHEISGTNPNYRKIIGEVHQGYKDVAKAMKVVTRDIRALGERSKTFHQIAFREGLAKPAVPKAVQAGKAINEALLKQEEKIVEQLNQHRNKTSPLRKKALDAGLTKEDDDHLLVPLMQAAYAENTKCQAAIVDIKLEVEEGIEHLAETFDSDEARAELQTMLSGAYRVETGLG
jgi:capsule polysaccharide export protein KpsE/RkpR